jgi:hypothetical protein
MDLGTHVFVAKNEIKQVVIQRDMDYFYLNANT